MRERILKMTSKFFKRRRCRLCAETLPEFLCKTAQALRASASLQKAIAMAADDTTGPLGEEARMVSRLASSGVDMSSALKVLGERVPEREILIFVESTIALRAAGASMSEMIEKIAEISAARIEVRGRIDAQNAQNKYQAVILGPCLGLCSWPFRSYTTITFHLF